jgi:hypothetical protein
MHILESAVEMNLKSCGVVLRSGFIWLRMVTEFSGSHGGEPSAIQRRIISLK